METFSSLTDSNDRKNPVVVATHMRSGTHLMIDFLRWHFESCNSWKWPGERTDSLYLALDVLSCNLSANWGARRAARILGRPARPILKVHWTSPDLVDLRASYPALADWIAETAIWLHVVRHPYKVLASLWAWECSMKGNELPACPTPDWCWERASQWRAHHEKWICKPQVHLFRFEDILQNPIKVRDDIAALLGEAPKMRSTPLPSKLSSVWHGRRNRLFSVRPASTEILMRCPSRSPDEIFGADCLSRISQVAGDVMDRLSYSLKE